MKTKILLNAPSSVAENFICMFRPLMDEIELHVITQTVLVDWYERQDVVFKVHDITVDYVRNKCHADVVDFVIPESIPLWEYVEFDRFLFRKSYEEIMLVARHHCWYIQNLLRDEKFDFILGEIGGFEHAILYWYGAANKLPFVWPMMSFWPEKFFLTFGGPLALQNQIAEIYRKRDIHEDTVKVFHTEAYAYIQTATTSAPPMVHVQDHIKVRTSIASQLFNFSIALPKRIRGLVRYLINPPRMYLDATPLKSLMMTYIRALSYTIFDRKVFANEVPTRERNVIYYLHYEPDLSTLVWSPYFKNQLEVITNIAFSLPNGYRLYVKEHPLSVGSRPIGYYKKIASIPNVRLLSHKLSTKSLLNNTSLVITVTGTIAWEALLFGKPVITLGNVFFNSFKGVVHLSDWAQLRRVVADLISSGSTYSQQDVIEFVSLVMAQCARGDYYKTITNPADFENGKLVAGEIIKFAKSVRESQ
jgi:hypothetical protein